MKIFSKKECCKQSKYVKFNGTMSKWSVQKPTHKTKHVEHQHNRTARILKYYILLTYLSNVGCVAGTWSSHTKPTHTRVKSPQFWSTHPICEIKKDYSDGGLVYLAPIVWLDIGYLAPILGQPLVLLLFRENSFNWLLKHVHII